jgi:hypothetical protein
MRVWQSNETPRGRYVVAGALDRKVKKVWSEVDLIRSVTQSRTSSVVD